MADGLTRLLAPILSFTADELWRHLPGAREESVHMALFPAAADLEAFADPALVERWNALLRLRERVPGARSSRCARTSRSAARCRRRSSSPRRPGELPLLERYATQLPMLFIVSEVELRPAPTDVETSTRSRCRA